MEKNNFWVVTIIAAAVLFVVGLAFLSSSSEPARNLTILEAPGLTTDSSDTKVERLEQALLKVDGVAAAHVSKKKGTIRIRHQKATTVAELKATAKGAGFDAFESLADFYADGAQ